MHPAGTQHQNDVASTSMRRDHVASTLIRRHFNVMCPLGMYFQTCASRENADQLSHSRSLIKIFTGHILDRQRCKVPSVGHKTLIRLRGRASLLESSLGAHVKRYVSSHFGSYDVNNIMVHSEYLCHDATS